MQFHVDFGNDIKLVSGDLLFQFYPIFYDDQLNSKRSIRILEEKKKATHRNELEWENLPKYFLKIIVAAFQFNWNNVG